MEFFTELKLKFSNRPNYHKGRKNKKLITEFKCNFFCKTDHRYEYKNIKKWK